MVRSQGTASAEPVEPPPEEPVIIRVDRRIQPDPETAADPEGGVADGTTEGTGGDSATEAVPEQPKPVATGTGWITLSAQPYGLDYDVFIDGKLVRKSGPRAPVVRHELTAGEHFVTISAAGGARKQFEVTIGDEEHVRKVWDFERNAWRR